MEIPKLPKQPKLEIEQSFLDLVQEIAIVESIMLRNKQMAVKNRKLADAYEKAAEGDAERLAELKARFSEKIRQKHLTD